MKVKFFTIGTIDQMNKNVEDLDVRTVEKFSDEVMAVYYNEKYEHSHSAYDPANVEER